MNDENTSVEKTQNQKLDKNYKKKEHTCLWCCFFKKKRKNAKECVVGKVTDVPVGIEQSEPLIPVEEVKISTEELTLNQLKDILEDCNFEFSFKSSKIYDLLLLLPSSKFKHVPNWLDDYSINDIESVFILNGNDLYGTKIVELKDKIKISTGCLTINQLKVLLNGCRVEKDFENLTFERLFSKLDRRKYYYNRYDAFYNHTITTINSLFKLDIDDIYEKTFDELREIVGNYKCN